MILFYTDQINQRIQYVLDFISQNWPGISFEVTEDWKTFTDRSIKTKWNYSNKQLDGVLNMAPHKLMLETAITEHEKICIWQHKTPHFFKTASSKNQTPFDSLAEIFWMLSRYEEYLAFQKDAHGRFPATASFAYKNHFLELPVVELWVDEILKTLKVKEKTENAIKIIHSIDVDIAYAFTGKGIVRNFLSTMRDLLTNPVFFLKRIAFWIGLEKDPYDSYNWIIKNSKPEELLFFFQMGYYKNPFDKSLGPQSKKLQKLIKKLGQNFEIGLHPSYQSNANHNLLKEEKKALENITKSPVCNSRQHFIKLEFPKTYENLIKNGILNDYSMGYPDAIGFRAGTCHRHHFFNLKKNKIEKLTITPFIFMDGTLKSYLNMTPHEASKKIVTLFDQIKKHQGYFVSIWHNSSLDKKSPWKAWKPFYLKILNIGKTT